MFMSGCIEALEIELGIEPLHIRRQELLIREGSKIISKSDLILIKKKVLAQLERWN